MPDLIISSAWIASTPRLLLSISQSWIISMDYIFAPYPAMIWPAGMKPFFQKAGYQADDNMLRQITADYPGTYRHTG